MSKIITGSEANQIAGSTIFNETSLCLTSSVLKSKGFTISATLQDNQLVDKDYVSYNGSGGGGGGDDPQPPSEETTTYTFGCSFSIANQCSNYGKSFTLTPSAFVLISSGRQGIEGDCGSITLPPMVVAPGENKLVQGTLTANVPNSLESGEEVSVRYGGNFYGIPSGTSCKAVFTFRGIKNGAQVYQTTSTLSSSYSQGVSIDNSLELYSPGTSNALVVTCVVTDW